MSHPHSEVFALASSIHYLAALEVLAVSPAAKVNYGVPFSGWGQADRRQLGGSSSQGQRLFPSFYRMAEARRLES